jgi:DnaJ domain
MGSAPDGTGGDLYKLLGLTPNASDDEIRDAYYELAKTFHPDKRRQDEKAAEAFRVIARAAAILRDPERRSLYDSGDTAEATLMAGPHGLGRRKDHGRRAMVFLVTVAVTFAIGAGLSIVVLKRDTASSNHAARMTASKAVNAPASPGAFNRGYVPKPASAPSLPIAVSDSGELQHPSSKNEKMTANEVQSSEPMTYSPSSLPASERSARIDHTKIDHGAASVSDTEAAKEGPKAPTREALAFGHPAFDVSWSNGKTTPAKVSFVRESKSRLDGCAVSSAARHILIYVSAALRAK